MKDQKQMIISVEAEKGFYRIQRSFMIKAINKVGIQGITSIKDIYDKSLNIILNGVKLQTFPAISWQGCPLTLLLINIIFKVLASAIKQGKQKISKLKRKK